MIKLDVDTFIYCIYYAKGSRFFYAMIKRHVRFYKGFLPPVRLFLQLKFKYIYKVKKDLPENYIVIANHTTDFDPLFVGVGLRRPMYFVGSEHIARWGWIYKFLKYGFDPILRSKGTVATSTVLDILRRLRKGDNICLFAEGVRSWDGISCPIHPSTAQLVKKAKCSLITYKLTGGYFASPMWSGFNTRRGEVHGDIVNIYSPEALAEMSVDEIHKAIEGDLYEDAYERQLSEPKQYKGRKLAENLETYMFICPHCNGRDTFESKKNTVCCKACGSTFTYGKDGFLHDFKFKTVRDYAKWQKDQVKLDAENSDVYTSPFGALTTVEDHVPVEVSSGEMSLSREALTCGDVSIPLNSITEFAMHGRRSLVFTADNKYYELKLPKTANAIKYHLLYDHIKELETVK